MLVVIEETDEDTISPVAKPNLLEREYYTYLATVRRNASLYWVGDEYHISLCELLGYKQPSAERCYLVLYHNPNRFDDVIVSELEAIIATCAVHSVLYAENVLKGRFELGEPTIAINGQRSWWYVYDVLNEFEIYDDDESICAIRESAAKYGHPHTLDS